MPAFDKNSVQIDYAYTISTDEEEESVIAPCPYCGELAQRKHRSVCLACKRRVPPTNSRHNWVPPVTNPYAEISPLVVRERKVKEQKFVRSRGPNFELMQSLRRFAVTAAAMFLVISATPYVVQMCVGESGMTKIKEELSYLVGQSEYVFGKHNSSEIAANTPHKIKS